jgi:hypothetical protein
MTNARSNVLTAILVEVACRIWDRTGRFTVTLKLLAKFIPAPVLERVLFHPELRRPFPFFD